LHIVDEAAENLGTSHDGQRVLFFARFTTSRGKPWHGYPADWVRRTSDIPDARLLGAWEKFGVRRATQRKILKGQRCVL
jgi:hypothetical protein